MGHEEKKEVKKGLLVLLLVLSIIITFIFVTCSLENSFRENQSNKIENITIKK